MQGANPDGFAPVASVDAPDVDLDVEAPREPHPASADDADLVKVIQSVTDAATELTGAAIGERVRTEQALRESEARLELATRIDTM